MSRRSFEITPELVLRAYRSGFFPMAETRDAADLFWLDPERRGVLPLEEFHLPRRLLRTALADTFEVAADVDFAAVIAACAAPRPGSAESWINPDIVRLFTALFEMGYAHTVECRREGALVGGLYGVAIGGAFFGESMFSRARDASKVALAHLIARLRLGGFRLLDTQFVTEHLQQFGATEIPRAEYRARLAAALPVRAGWLREVPPASLEAELRAMAGG
jgi:leucyl/phenylalanyl-tRNA---protein transferase